MTGYHINIHKNTNNFDWMKIINSSMSFAKGKERWVLLNMKEVCYSKYTITVWLSRLMPFMVSRGDTL